jgi:pimeloyl-ACP methyl ester carboxylesterase
MKTKNDYPGAYLSSSLLYVTILFSFFSATVLAQDYNGMALKRFGFSEYKIMEKQDTIWFYLNQKKNSKPDKLVVYLQGTTPFPESFFNVFKKEEGYAYTQNFPSDYELLNEKYAFVVIGLPGVPAVNGKENTDIQKYHSLNSLQYRVHSADTVIDFIDAHLYNLQKIIIYGHSEGAPVAAKLGTINSKITHIGFWGGNALPDFFDFILFDRKGNIKEQQSDSTTAANIDAYINLFREIANDSLNTVPANTNEITEYTNKRWWSYAEPPINNLLKIEIPIYVQAATEDENAPIESNYLIPLEFIRLGKKNLTFRVCISCDHGFVNRMTHEDLWPEIFKNFIQWTEEN